MSSRITRFLEEQAPPAPCLVIDLDVVAGRYHHMREIFPTARVFYAVKANPHRQLVRLLAQQGASFDVASPGEIDLCLREGAAPENLSYGNTIKKPDAVRHAYARGVRLFAIDSAAELDKISRLAPGSAVFCRIRMDGGSEGWPLGDKFGCSTQVAADLLQSAQERGLRPYGVSFHVGSQQLDPSRWESGIALFAEVLEELRRREVYLELLNVGGGFPARYVEEIPPLEAYGNAIHEALGRSFGPPTKWPEIAMEPGRYIAGDAGVMRTSVVLVSRKSYGDGDRWVYLDAGRYGGLAETEGEAIRYRVTTPDNGGTVGPAILAGPTCDSTDILYQHAMYQVPLDLGVGDSLDLLSAGAYTASYSAVGFNGFSPLPTYCLGGRV